MRVHWFEQTEKDLPILNDWLSADEISRLEGMRFLKRRSDWRLGRWTAKHALACYLKLPFVSGALGEIEIRPESSGAPVLFISGEKCPLSISLSHRSGTALCAIAPVGVALGCDLELSEERDAPFITDYFAVEEQQYLASSPAEDRWRILTLLWSAKESVLKALRVGLRVDTRSLTVQLPDTRFHPSSWNPLQVSCPDGTIFHGWHVSNNSLVRTLVADLSPEVPVPLLPGTLHGMTTDRTSSQSIDIASLCDSYASQQQ